MTQNSWITKKGYFILSWFKEDRGEHIKAKYIHFCGYHEGEISGNNIEVESYESTTAIMDRVEELGLIITPKMAEDILARAEKSEVNLTEDDIARINNYVTNN